MTRYALIGAGGLGGPVAYALAGRAECITVCDDDRVELSNLQRQVQFTTDDVGRLKVAALADELVRRGIDRERVRALPIRFSAATADDILRSADVVIDGSDNFETKFAVNDAACSRRLPVVIGGVLRYAGQVVVAYPGVTGCYRCLFEAPPDVDEDTSASCTEAGVLGAAVAVVGAVAAREAERITSSHPRTQTAGTVFVLDDLRRDATPRAVRFNPRPGCSSCQAAQSSEFHSIEERK